MSDPVLQYFCYGGQAIYDQAIYSILSLLHVGGGAPRGCRVVVYCDRPEAFAGLPVEAVPVARATLDAWLDGGDYVHRRKTCAIIDALERFGGTVVFVDTDTWFRRAPAPLFRRVGPGRACFHLCEGYLQSTGTPSDDALARQLAAGNVHTRSGEAVTLSARTPMWNTGVVGVHAADLGRVREALALSDAIWAGADPAGAYCGKIHHGEQFAMGYAFRDTRLSEAADCVYHYWPRATKEAFGARLPGLAATGAADPSPETLARLYAARPRQTGVDAARDTLKMAVRRLALTLRLPVRGVRRSVG